MKTKLSMIFGETIGLLICASAIAAPRAPDFTIKVSSSSEAGKILLEATAPSQHHFNLEAPINAELESNHNRVKPARAGESSILFEIPSPAKDGAKVTIYLCDNAKTYCEKHQVKASWAGQANAAAAPKTVSQEHLSPRSQKSAIDSHGFYDNRPNEAFAKAKETGKPLFIDFYGIWCPPCNELNDQVFSKRPFRKSAAEFVRLKMDADAPETEALLQRYGIQGFPTVIFASPEGDEIGRVVGFRPLREFLAEMKAASADRTQSFAALKVKADAGDRAAADRLGVIYLDRADYELAQKYLKDTKTRLQKLREAEIETYHSLAKKGDAEANRKWIEALQNGIREFPKSPDAIQWRENLASALDTEKKPEEAKRARIELIAAAKNLLSKPARLKGYDMSTADLYVTIGEAASDLGEKSEASAAFSSGAELYRKRIQEGDERGGTLELAYCLRQIGKTDEAAQLYQTMQKRFPTEFTFWLADAKMNLQLKNFDRARELAKTAYENSYGANKLDSALILAKALKELGKNDDARAIISQAIDSLPATPPTANPAARSRIRSRVENLNQLSAELAKSKAT